MLILQLKHKHWYTPIHVENIGASTKVHLIFWFLIKAFNLCFYHHLLDKWISIHIGNSSGHTGQTHSQIPEMSVDIWQIYIEVASLIICSINYNVSLTYTSSTDPEVKKTGILCSKFNKFVYLKRNFHLLKI